MSTNEDAADPDNYRRLGQPVGYSVRTWASKRQWAYMETRFDDYVRAASARVTEGFLVTVRQVCCDILTDPLVPLEDRVGPKGKNGIEPTVQQLNNWFRNHRHTDATQGRKLMHYLYEQVKAPRTRAPTRLEVYQRLESDKISEAVHQEWTNSDSRSGFMQVNNSVRTKLWQGEGTDVKARVEEIYVKENSDEAKRERQKSRLVAAGEKPGSFGYAVTAAPAVILEFLERMHAETGLIFSIAIGGITKKSSDIHHAWLHVGESPDGQTFGDHHAPQVTTFSKVFGSFTKLIMPREKRKELASLWDDKDWNLRKRGLLLLDRNLPDPSAHSSTRSSSASKPPPTGVKPRVKKSGAPSRSVSASHAITDQSQVPPQIPSVAHNTTALRTSMANGGSEKDLPDGHVSAIDPELSQVSNPPSPYRGSDSGLPSNPSVSPSLTRPSQSQCPPSASPPLHSPTRPCIPAIDPKLSQVSDLPNPSCGSGIEPHFSPPVSPSLSRPPQSQRLSSASPPLHSPTRPSTTLPSTFTATSIAMPPFNSSPSPPSFSSPSSSSHPSSSSSTQRAQFSPLQVLCGGSAVTPAALPLSSSVHSSAAILATPSSSSPHCQPPLSQPIPGGSVVKPTTLPLPNAVPLSAPVPAPPSSSSAPHSQPSPSQPLSGGSIAKPIASPSSSAVPPSTTVSPPSYSLPAPHSRDGPDVPSTTLHSSSVVAASTTIPLFVKQDSYQRLRALMQDPAEIDLYLGRCDLGSDFRIALDSMQSLEGSQDLDGWKQFCPQCIQAGIYSWIVDPSRKIPSELDETDGIQVFEREWCEWWEAERKRWKADGVLAVDIHELDQDGYSSAYPDQNLLRLLLVSLSWIGRARVKIERTAEWTSLMFDVRTGFLSIAHPPLAMATNADHPSRRENSQQAPTIRGQVDVSPLTQPSAEHHTTPLAGITNTKSTGSKKHPGRAKGGASAQKRPRRAKEDASEQCNGAERTSRKRPRCAKEDASAQGDGTGGAESLLGRGKRQRKRKRNFDSDPDDDTE